MEFQFSGTCAATSKSMDFLLSTPKKGRAVILVVGGAREVLCQDHDHIDLIILKRKGFIKKALKHGSALVPTFSFGEAFIYDNMFPNPRGSWIRSIQEYIVDKTRWPFPFFFGRGIFQYTFGLLPQRIPITVVSKFYRNSILFRQFSFYREFNVFVNSIFHTVHTVNIFVKSIFVNAIFPNFNFS